MTPLDAPTERELVRLADGVIELAASLERDILLSRDRESHVRVSTRASRAATLAQSAQRLLTALEPPAPVNPVVPAVSGA